MVGAAQKTGKSIDDVRAAQQKQIPAQRFGTPAEFGAICAFLCSQQAAYLTGQNILPDGGRRRLSFGRALASAPG
jgi:3-oxoacyl-[acyl-carrier protein] reductase